MKVCKNCKNYTLLGLCVGAGKNNARDFISGVPIVTAKAPEKMRYYEDYCGIAGKWFEEKAEGK